GVAAREVGRAGEAGGTEVERVHARGPEPHGGEREQPAAAPDVEERAPVEALDLEHLAQRALGLGDARVVEHVQEARPVLAELEALAAGDLVRMVGSGGCAKGRTYHGTQPVFTSISCKRHEDIRR